MPPKRESASTARRRRRKALASKIALETQDDTSSSLSSCVYEEESEDDLYTSSINGRTSSSNVHSIPEEVYGSCFHTTGMIQGRGICVEVTHMLFDTGASATFISPQAVEAARLQVYNCEPQNFRLANGELQSCNNFVRLRLYIAGNGQDIHAFIDKNYTGHHMLIGQPTLSKFSARSNHDITSGKSLQWTIAGARGRRVIVNQDLADGAPSLRKFDYGKGMQRAERPGETAQDREARESVERSFDILASEQARLDDLKLRHAHLLARHRYYVCVRHGERTGEGYAEFPDDYEEYDEEFGPSDRGHWSDALIDLSDSYE